MKPVDEGDRITYYIGVQWYMYKIKIWDTLCIYDKIYEHLETNFNYEYIQLRRLIKGVVENNTDLTNITPYGERPAIEIRKQMDYENKNK